MGQIGAHAGPTAAISVTITVIRNMTADCKKVAIYHLWLTGCCLGQAEVSPAGTDYSSQPQLFPPVCFPAALDSKAVSCPLAPA